MSRMLGEAWPDIEQALGRPLASHLPAARYAALQDDDRATRARALAVEIAPVVRELERWRAWR